MSKNKGYIIETVLSSSKEYGSGSVDGQIVLKQAPFSLRPYMARFRKGCVPYMVGSKTALDLGMRVDCNAATADTCSCAVRYAISGTSDNGNLYRLNLGTSLAIKNDISNSPDGWTMAFWVKTTQQSYAWLYNRGTFGTPSTSEVGDMAQSFSVLDDSSPGFWPTKPEWSMWLGDGLNMNTRVRGGDRGSWCLGVFQASASAGTLSGTITVVSASGAGGWTKTVQSANPIGTSSAEGAASYLGALEVTGVLRNYNAGPGYGMADFAIWDKTLSMAEITGTLWNNGKPLCLTGSSPLYGNLQHWWRMGDGKNDTSGNGGIIYDHVGSVNATIVTADTSVFDIVNLSGSESIHTSCSSS